SSVPTRALLTGLLQETPAPLFRVAAENLAAYGGHFRHQLRSPVLIGFALRSRLQRRVAPQQRPRLQRRARFGVGAVGLERRAKPDRPPPRRARAIRGRRAARA